MKKERWKIVDYIFMVALFFQGAGNFNVLPLNLFQILIIVLGVVLLIGNRFTCSIPKKIVYLLVYMALITFWHKFDFESVKGIGYFSIQITVLAVYFKNSIKNPEKLIKIIYTVAVPIAIYGIIQEIAFVLNIPAIYDLSLYGFARNGTYETGFGLMRVMSVYAEPAHLASIMPIAIIVGLYGKDRCLHYVSSWKTAMLVLCGILSQSIIVYFCFVVLFACYILFVQEKNSKKVKFVVVGVVVLMLVSIVLGDSLLVIFSKLNGLTDMEAYDNNNLSSFAIWSNLLVAVEKIKDGYYLGTGYDSHRLYYDNYIGRHFFNVLQCLNSEDAASLYTRILSEFGLVGLIVTVNWCIIKFKKLKNEKQDILLLMLMNLIVITIRNGSYIEIMSMISFILVFLQFRWGKINNKIIKGNDNI